MNFIDQFFKKHSVEDSGLRDLPVKETILSNEIEISHGLITHKIWETCDYCLMEKEQWNRNHCDCNCHDFMKRPYFSHRNMVGCEHCRDKYFK